MYVGTSYSYYYIGITDMIDFEAIIIAIYIAIQAYSPLAISGLYNNIIMKLYIATCTYSYSYN